MKKNYFPKNSEWRTNQFIVVIIICFLLTGLAGQGYGFPKPGDVFREYHLVGGGSNGNPDAEWQDDFVFISHHTGELSTKGDRRIEKVDLKHAVKAEFVAVIWGGHLGSENKRVIFNDNSPVALPLIKNTPNNPLCYHFQQSQAACEVPLAHLKQGDNDFRLEVDNQICYSFDWGWFWTNQVVLRVYYDKDKVDHPSGKMATPAPNSTITELSKISCEIESGNVTSVEFIGKY